ncbi:hypothetical protein HIM_06668 [Hirsutella minnesotensis 3608]|uniref:Carrier domain-containing protein n=1 Tax=Hirsutella minnesotensis 3608 TaxID=1043627 RepID=A0A0F7ZNM3_9HYPO|nr:hypothetical protein HIM_06668 [Hirsutella minnesotensis 3608]
MPSLVSNFEEEYDLVVEQNSGLGDLFYNQVQKSPEAVAVVDGDASLTYAQLHNVAAHLAHKIKQWMRHAQEPVGIVVQHGVGDVVAQMAVIYAGGSCAPMDPTLDDQQIQRRLKRLGAQCVLADEANLNRNLNSHIICVDHVDEAQGPRAKHQYPISVGLEHCTHLIHTSGTTSEPKAVRIAARSIVHVVYHAPFEPVFAKDVVAHVNNSSFDVSLFDIWGPLLRGARVAVLSKAVLLDLPVMAREIDRLGITVMATTTALLNLAAFTYPRAFSKLRICFIGGEAANLSAIKVILDQGSPGMLVNAYGPTECCIFCLTHLITDEDVQSGSVSIGKPIGRTITHIVNDDGQADDEGELWIGGPGVSPGYVDQPEKNAAAFTASANLKGFPKDKSRMYRTGDIVRRRPDGQIEYIGRRDHQVKVRGFRIELGAVEAALLKTGAFVEAVAMKVDLPRRGAGSILVAYVVLADMADPLAVHKGLESVRAMLPDYMIPQLEVVSKMPLNNHVKIDRKHLAQLFSQRWEAVSALKPWHAYKDVRATLEDLWASILATPVSIFKSSDDFVALGGTSLQTSLLVGQIRNTFGVEVSLLTLYDNSSLGKLTSVIKQGLRGKEQALPDERDLWLADSKIADDIPCPDGPVIDWCSPSEGRVFITGATGFVGAFMLADLLRMPHVTQVGCLVRASDAAAGFQRLKDAMAKYKVWDECFAGKLLAIPGLLEEPDLGLGPDRFHELAQWASVVFHLGARVNYTQPYSLHRAVNTLGTRNIVQFACTSRVKSVHYVSSISCFGPTGFVTGTTLVKEDESLLPHLVALPYDHGYSQSQWVADQLMRTLMDRGFPVAVYRPGFITGHSETGACNPDDFFSRLMHSCCQMGCFPLLPNQRKEFVPVDYVNAAILHIAASAESLGHAYHIVPPSSEYNVDMDETMHLVGQAAGMSMHGVPYADWAERLATQSPQRLLPLRPMLSEKVQDGLTRWELYANMPTYDTSNTARALADYPGGLQMPVLGVPLMRKYLSFLKGESQ